MRALVEVLLLALELYEYVVVATVIMSWLIGFNVVNIRNDVVRSIWTMLNALTEPVLAPIRRVLPSLGSIDISPIILFLGIEFVKRVLVYYILPGLY
jgi:YggT family protein